MHLAQQHGLILRQGYLLILLMEDVLFKTIFIFAIPFFDASDAEITHLSLKVH